MSNSSVELYENGFAVFDCKVNKKELNKYRQSAGRLLDLIGVKKHQGIRLPYAFKYCPESIDIFGIFDGLKSGINDALSASDWFLTGHCDLHKNALSGWHRDDGTSYNDGGYFGKPNPDYRTMDLGVFKVAVYLQSHHNFEDGITVEPGSHIRDRRDPSKESYLRTKLGQVVIFDQRLWHTGQIAKLPNPLSDEGLKIIQNIGGVKLDEKNVVKSFTDHAVEKFETIRGDRMSVFFTIRRSAALGSSPAITFERNNMRRQVFEMSYSGRSTFQSSSLITRTMKDNAISYGLQYSSHCEVEV